MKFSHRILKELSGTKKSAKQLEKLLMFHAFEVEEVVSYEHGLEGVYVGEVMELVAHPNADKLRVATVNVGRQGMYTIVCGAPNVAVGQKVAVVLPGGRLGDFEITERDLRGVTSQGMICSEKELRIGAGHEGILVLPEETPIGVIFAKYFGLDDSVLDIKILPDRAGDALSYQGVAREIAALDGYAPEFTEIEKKALRIPHYNRAPKVSVIDTQGCSRFVGLYFENITVGESPLWLKVALLVSGITPKNNVVDMTNYLMLLTGQPLHAYDADKIDKEIKVRKAKKGEKVKLLNDTTITLTTQDIVIADAKKVLGLAGIMGGKSSAVTSKTKNVFIEIAHFEGGIIRRSRTHHKLFTDASYRFERNLDPNLPKEVAGEVVELFGQVCDTKLLGMRDVKHKDIRPRKIKLALDRVNGVLGSKVPLFEVVQYLALLGLGVKKLPGAKILDVTIPTRRRDLVDEWNLIEEIGRMRGYDKITAQAPLVTLQATEEESSFRKQQQAKDILVHLGFSECLTYSFVSLKEGEQYMPKAHLYALANPLNPEEIYLRPSLLIGLIKAVARNTRFTKTQRLFELGNVFEKTKKGPKESLRLAFVVTGKGKESVFMEGKEVLESFLGYWHTGEKVRYEVASTPNVFEEPRLATRVLLGTGEIGSLSVLAHTEKKQWGLSGSEEVVLCEIDVQALWEKQKEFVFTPLPKFPEALRDIALTVERGVTAQEIEEVFARSGQGILTRYELFDIYEKEDKKRVSYHLGFSHPERTLTGQEMEEAFQDIVRNIGEELGGTL